MGHLILEKLYMHPIYHHIYNDQASSIFHIQRKAQEKHYGIEVILYASIHDFSMYEHAFM